MQKFDWPSMLLLAAIAIIIRACGITIGTWVLHHWWHPFPVMTYQWALLLACAFALAHFKFALRSKS